jgi:hypothetical protein
MRVARSTRRALAGAGIHYQPGLTTKRTKNTKKDQGSLGALRVLGGYLAYAAMRTMRPELAL